MDAQNRLAVVAIGGNALIRDREHQGIPDQYEAALVTVHGVADMIEAGWNVIVTHGNGPQMGYILRRSELAIHEVAPVPMDYAGADLQGALGYMFVRAFRNEFTRRGMAREPVAVVTETLVDPADPAFADPSKPIGTQMDEAAAAFRCRGRGRHVARGGGGDRQGSCLRRAGARAGRRPVRAGDGGGAGGARLQHAGATLGGPHDARRGAGA